MEKELLVKSPVVVRVYVIDCYNLPGKDFNSESDPFISVKLGE
jgi:Ca2+-dependent lipid-binding protein